MHERRCFEQTRAIVHPRTYEILTIELLENIKIIACYCIQYVTLSLIRTWLRLLSSAPSTSSGLRSDSKMRSDDRSRTPGTRRNGTLQSCEPCRRAKQRCDHDRPICRRCAAKRISDKCFYHPSPMTRQKPSDVVNPEGIPNSLTSQPTSRYALL